MLHHFQRRLLVVITAVIFAFGWLWGTVPGGAHPIRAATEPYLRSDKATAQYGKLPLSFIANAGQSDPAVRFQVRSGGTLSFENNGVLLNLPTPVGTAFLPSDARYSDTQKRVPASIHLAFLGANPNSSLSGADQLPGIANFFIGSDPAQWHTDVPTYTSVLYHDLYPGVDLSYTGHAGLLKGTYTLAAGVDPARIRWQYTGVDRVAFDSSSGNLTLHAPDGGVLTEQAPVAWQTRADGTQTRVTVVYQVNADGSVQFAPDAYDRSLPLTIDPALEY
jgi:hypothetical protein